MIWHRRDKPILSASWFPRTWCGVELYNPSVLRRDGRYLMWFVGNGTHTRSTKSELGLAESDDGIHWRVHPEDSVLSGPAVGWGPDVHTPCVLFDEQREIYQLWFVSTTDFQRDANGHCIESTQQLGYATSRDGVRWDVHPQPIFPSGRGPCVLLDGGRYRMWMNSRISRGDRFDTIYKHIYHFESDDGIHWTRDAQPSVTPGGLYTTCVYPCVRKIGERYRMWFGGHVAGGKFELFTGDSLDGVRWQIDDRRVDFPASRQSGTFDCRYVSTPCVLCDDAQYRMYYSARSCQNDYIDGNGVKRSDPAGVYASIGLATGRTT